MKAKTILKRYKNHDDLKRDKTLPAKRVVFLESDNLAVLFQDGSFTLSKARELDGIVEGYNLNALTAAWAAHRLGLLTEKEYEEFSNWYSKASNAQHRADAIAQAKRVLESHGYQVTK